MYPISTRYWHSCGGAGQTTIISCLGGSNLWLASLRAFAVVEQAWSRSGERAAVAYPLLPCAHCLFSGRTARCLCLCNDSWCQLILLLQHSFLHCSWNDPIRTEVMQSCAQNPFMTSYPAHLLPALANASSLYNFFYFKPYRQQADTALLLRYRCLSVCSPVPLWFCSVTSGTTLDKIAVALFFIWFTVTTTTHYINLLVIYI